MIDVKQIFESVILGEALGNLNNIPNANAKKIVTTLLKDKQIRKFAEVSPNSVVDKIGTYLDIADFNSPLKKYTAMGHRVGAIVFIPTDGVGGTNVTVITDERYIQDGAVRNNLKVRNSLFTTGNSGRFGDETTLGKVYKGYGGRVGLSDADSVEVYVILRDPTLVGKMDDRFKNKQVDDPYLSFGSGTPGQTTFMHNAMRTVAENRMVDVDRMTIIQAVVEFHNLANKYKNDYNAVTTVKVDGETYQVKPNSIWMSHSTGALKDLAISGVPFPICSIELVTGGVIPKRLNIQFDKNFKIIAHVG